MCIGETDSATFIRRRDAAIQYMTKLLDVQKLSVDDAIDATSYKFQLNTQIREDYRIYKSLLTAALLD